MSSINVLMLSWEFPPRVVGGIAAHLYDLSRALVKKGAKVTVITCDFPETEKEEYVDGVYVYRVDSYHFPSPDFASWTLLMNLNMQKEALDLVNSMGLDKIDIIHAHDWLVAPTAIALKHCFRKPLIATIHSTEYGRRRGINSDYQRMIHEIEWWLTYESWKTICCSKYMSEQVAHVFGLPKDKITIIPNGVDPSKFYFEFNHEDFKKKFAFPWEKIVLFVGRLVPEKGVNVLIGAVPKILSSYPNVKFIVVGDGYTKSSAMDLAWYFGVYHKIFFTGFVEESTLRSLYKIADVVTVPSVYEPFGIVALEAMAANVPLVVSDSCGLPEIVEHDVDGVKVHPDNSDSLASGLLRILTDSGYADKIRNNASKKIHEIYNWDRIAEKTMLL